MRLPFVDVTVPEGVLFKLLGFYNLGDICEFIALHSPIQTAAFADMTQRSLDHALLYESRQYLIEHLGKEGTKEATTQRRVRYIEHILSNEFLPHQRLDSSEEVLHRKAVYLAMIVIQLLRVYAGDSDPDDRDDYALKRIETTGGLFVLLFRQLFRQFLKMLGLQLARVADGGKHIPTDTMINAKKITAGIKYAVSTGNGGI